MIAGSCILVFALLFPAFAGPAAVDVQSWDSFLSRDRSLAFDYPKGWEVSESESVIEITNPAAEEQLLVLGVPFDSSKTPRELAEHMISLIRTGMPDMAASDWRTAGDARTGAVYFRTRYSREGRKFDSNVIVVKDESHAVWFSFSGPLPGYDPLRAVRILTRVTESAAKQQARSGPPPAPPPKSEKSQQAMRQNGEAFLFVLEFALGSPLTLTQEKAVLTELYAGWNDQDPEALRPYDQYPVLAKAILQADQAELGELSRDLKAAVREWIEENRGKSRAVGVIDSELKRGEKVLLFGKPDLTERAAAAYSEMIAFSELLGADGAAQPEDISPASVERVRQQLKQQWPNFTSGEREVIAASPGLWLCLRTVMAHGSSQQQEKTRAQIRGLSTGRAVPDSTRAVGGDSAEKIPDQMKKVWVMGQLNRMVTNTFRWANGLR